jgi:outer membrane protein
MNSKLVLIAALAAGTLTAAAQAQTTSPQPAASAAPTAPPPPQAIPAKIALIELQEVASATNEGQNAVVAVQKKYEPTKQKLDGERAEIDSLTKQLQGAPATMPEEEKASRARAIDTKQKQLQLEAEDAQTSYGTDVQAAIGKVIGKLGPLVVKYVQQNGYTMLLDNSAAQQQQQSGGLNLLWGGSDISQAVVDAYNAAYPAAVAVPSAPSATRPRTTTPRPTPKP